MLKKIKEAYHDYNFFLRLGGEWLFFLFGLVLLPKNYTKENLYRIFLTKESWQRFGTSTRSLVATVIKLLVVIVFCSIWPFLIFFFTAFFFGGGILSWMVCKWIAEK